MAYPAKKRSANVVRIFGGVDGGSGILVMVSNSGGSGRRSKSGARGGGGGCKVGRVWPWEFVMFWGILIGSRFDVMNAADGLLWGFNVPEFFASLLVGDDIPPGGERSIANWDWRREVLADEEGVWGGGVLENESLPPPNCVCEINA